MCGTGVPLVLDQEFHDQPELVSGQVAGLGNLRILGVLQINGGKDDAVDPGVFHGGLALQLRIKDDAVAVDAASLVSYAMMESALMTVGIP